jgi:hypothetical protein
MQQVQVNTQKAQRMQRRSVNSERLLPLHARDAERGESATAGDASTQVRFFPFFFPTESWRMRAAGRKRSGSATRRAPRFPPHLLSFYFFSSTLVHSFIPIFFLFLLLLSLSPFFLCVPEQKRHNRRVVEPGMKGWIITCSDSSHPGHTVRDAQTLFNTVCQKEKERKKKERKERKQNKIEINQGNKGPHSLLLIFFGSSSRTLRTTLRPPHPSPRRRRASKTRLPRSAAAHFIPKSSGVGWKDRWGWRWMERQRWRWRGWFSHRSV